MTPEPRAQSALRIACIQMEPVVGATEANVEKTLALIARACADGARLVVLPELCNSGYVFQTREEAFAQAELVPRGPSTQAWAEAAAQHGAVIVAGVCERDGGALYNSAVVIGPEGFLGTYRKT